MSEGLSQAASQSLFSGASSRYLATAAATINAWWVVGIDAAGLAYPVDKDVSADGPRVLGLATFAALSGELVEVVTDGLVLTGATWTPGPLYVGDNGALTSTPPGAGYHLQIAVAVTTTTLIVRPQFLIYLV